MADDTLLKTLLDRAVLERDQALALVQRAQEHTRALQLQAQQLADYRSEYRTRWSASFAREGAIEIVHCYRGFMARLDDAIAQQQQRQHEAEKATHKAREQLLDREKRVAAVRKLLERREREQLRLDGRRERRASDEAAQRMQSRRSSSRWMTTTVLGGEP